MSDTTGDFLGLSGLEFESRESFISYLDQQYRQEKLTGSFNIIAAVNNLDDPAKFAPLLKQRFNVLEENDDLLRIHTTVDEEPVYSYIFLDNTAPIFLTNANKTDQIPPTIIRFLQETQNVGRLMLSKREIDETRKAIVSEHENVMIPFFSARRSADEPITAQRRPDTERSIQYRANDGLETYREMRYNYGVLPSIMTFECPNQFKFKIKSDGTFVHSKGGLETLWGCLKQEIERVEEVVRYANTGSYEQTESAFISEEEQFTVSRPWAVEIEEGISAEPIKSLPTQLNSSFWEFSVADCYLQPEIRSFEAEVIDDTTQERTTMKTKGNDIRIYPREFTDVDQSLRLYNFISDHFDADCKPKKVA
ncbi:hypothetical protein [Natrinema pallidum]|uniref:Uncharacterized protein n=2 Tax=Natrinema pallidum TaxID=69527 RepID=L9Z1U0_9EURY|nr:hypothetical protein [Natrinema pallidum]ELY79881.1 hypothetical protein C487_05839 [Natrinema pallidum DSM 3751]QCW02249.1 hypothetical protein FGF80_02925 [Natrinema pallidum]